MAMTASSGVAQGAGSVPAAGQAERSPFVRTTELLAPYQPGKPLITLSLGEPQHPVPGLRRPGAGKAHRRFRPLSAGQGHRAVPPRRWRTGCRPASSCRAPSIPRAKCWCLTAAARDCSSPPSPHRVYVGNRRGRPAILMPNPFYPAYGAGARAAGCEQVYLPTTVANGFLPDLDSLDDALLARTVAMFIASPANPQGAVASRDYFARLKQLADRFGFFILSDECYSEIYTRGSTGQRAGGGRTRFRQCRRVPVAVEALEPAGHARRLRRRRQEIPRRVSRAAQCRSTAGAGAAAAGGGRRLWRRGACRGKSQAVPDQVRSRRPDPCPVATAIAGPPAASASGSTSPTAAATRRHVSGFIAMPACA